MVVSSGFLDHAAEVYLRANGLITYAQSINNTLNRSTEWSQQPAATQLSLNRQQIEHSMQNPSIQQQSPQHQQQSNGTQNSSVMQSTINSKVNSNGQSPARVILICHSNSHPFQVRKKQDFGLRFF